jgi:hypothetical protein
MKLNGYSQEFVNKKITSAGGRILLSSQHKIFDILCDAHSSDASITRVLMNPSRMVFFKVSSKTKQ